jgi:MFS family permease
MGARFGENVSYYVFTLFVLTYATEELGLPRTTVLNAVLVAAFVHFATLPVWGALSDRFGRRPLYMLGAVGVGVWTFAFFPMVDTGSFTVIALAISVGLLLHGMMYGPQAAFFSELFSTRARYTAPRSATSSRRCSRARSRRSSPSPCSRSTGPPRRSRSTCW